MTTNSTSQLDQIIGANIGVISSEERLPVVILLDCSGSMSVYGNLESAVAAANSYIAELRADSNVAALVDLKVMTFNGDVEVVQDWTCADRASFIDPASIEARGNTNLDHALREAIKATRLKAREANLLGANVKVPIVVLVSDFHGIVSDDLVDEVRQRDEHNKLNIWAYAVQGANTKVLSDVCQGKRLLEAGNGDDRLGLAQYFGLMFAVTKTVSQSAPGEKPQMPANPLADPDAILRVPDVNAWLS